ncbi:hypothetical protein BD626DRAFT_179652 [Schizophyllum amplum]|uniref:START domain-containing protein n=1 Tax=Schizophyllum amplum TaxID=97359 RepID=A0A550C1W2_9AGAR|nr:hypothetical protein BD626DRAFT_179652 [Auriculariopsis ampla]
MSDGSRVRQSWYTALNDAESRFRQLLASPPSEWRRVQVNTDKSASGRKGKARASAIPEVEDVVVHRNSSNSGDDIFRLVLDVPAADETCSLSAWHAVLSTPEIRQEWDPAVDDAHIVELLDDRTRVTKTNFTLGWPASPRDAVMISRTLQDASTVIDLSTSLPRSPDEPAYLRPSPPFVRSHISLFAWCIQHVGSKVRMTCFWQHDLRSIWNFSTNAGMAQQLSTMTVGLLKAVVKRNTRVPKLVGFGLGVSVERVRFQLDREALTVDYSIIPEDDDPSPQQAHDLEELYAIREKRRLTRAIEWTLPHFEGWDVQVTTKASSEEVERLPWTANATRPSSSSLIVLRISHAPLEDDHSVLKVRVVLEISGPSSGLRLNGIPKPVDVIEERDPTPVPQSQPILQDVASAVTEVSAATTSSSTSNTSNLSDGPTPMQPQTKRTAAAEKSILSRVRRNYIYFSSLLQEPEAKWRRNTDARGVSVTQLDSIDPTLVVYRAEATFVGVGIWDLYSALVTPGARSYWDKQHEDATLLEDFNELTELWHWKVKPAWPVNGRDSVVLKTVYKSPKTIHVFMFSADDPHLFSNIPPPEPNIIRTQTDLQGWAIEALSPTTTSLTLLDQSDPKGWSNKTSIPTQMVNTVAGIGEYAIKCGGPPVVSRLSGARATDIRYDHEKQSFRLAYEVASARRAAGGGVELELRCDVETWAGSLDIVVDPPPQAIACLRRHRFSEEGGGLWLTLTHDAVYVDDERLLAIVRRGPGRERGLVLVNGTRIHVDVEDLPDAEVKTLAKKKRVKPTRIPLDQPPVFGAIRRRRAEWEGDSEATPASETGTATPAELPGKTAVPPVPATNAFARFFTYAVEQATATTQQTVAAISPTSASGEYATPSTSTLPMEYALKALAWAQESHAMFTSEGWALVSEKDMLIHRKMSGAISPAIPVHKGEKVIQGVSAEEIAAVITDLDCRKQWDDRFVSATKLQSFGMGCRTAFVVSRSNFPFRDRGFYVATVMGRAVIPPVLSRRSTSGEVTEQGSGPRNAIFCLSASFNASHASAFDAAKYNPYNLPIGRTFVDAWILETLDPYTKENYAIPSTRCARLVAVDYAGSMPSAVNAQINAELPRSILALEALMKNLVPSPLTRLPATGLVISDKKTEEPFIDAMWRLRRRDENRLLLDSNFSAEDRVYTSIFLVRQPRKSRAGIISADQTPRPSQLGPGSRRQSSAADRDRPQSAAEPMQSSPTLDGLPFMQSSLSTLTTASAASATAPTSSPKDVTTRARSASSAFTMKGEVRPSTDLLVAEFVVESKLYPSGYAVDVRSSTRASCLASMPGDCVALDKLKDASNLPNTDLPLHYTVHTMPSSPLHSSGLKTDDPTRHLVRMTLPTALYQVSTIQDPLTGETRTAPPKPQWLLDLEDGGFVLSVAVRPRGGGETKPTHIVSINGQDVDIVGEKESLTALGRDELLEDRALKMAVLTRISNEAHSFPEELTVPSAISDDLLDPNVPSPSAAVEADPVEDTDETMSMPGEEERAGTPQPESVDTPPDASTNNGLIGLLQSYQRSMSRFNLNFTSSGSSTKEPPGTPRTLSKTPHSSSSSLATIAHSKPRLEKRGSGQRITKQAAAPGRMHPTSTLIVVALVAFLLGSLLRSLLSPADFIYVAADIHDTPQNAQAYSGWREIKRLLEIKYLVGGYDFQVALVRRYAT